MNHSNSIYDIYTNIQKNYDKSFILFLKVGSFYEVFGENALLLSTLFGLTVVDKPIGSGSKIGMCGVPVKSVNPYITRLLELSYKVVLTDESKTSDKKSILRDVVKIITPGTVIDEIFSSQDVFQNIIAVAADMNYHYAFSFDLTVGGAEIYKIERNAMRLGSLMLSLDPREVLIFDATVLEDIDDDFKEIAQVIPFRSATDFDMIQCIRSSCEHMSADVLNSTFQIKCLYSLFLYLNQIYCNKNFFLRTVHGINLDDFCEISHSALYGLEVFKNYHGDKNGTLFQLMSACFTKPGKRLLKSLLSRPLTSPYMINNRLDTVEFFIKESDKRNVLIEYLKGQSDIERSVVRIFSDVNTREELLSLVHSFKRLLAIYHYIKDFSHVPYFLNLLIRKTEKAFDVINEYCDLFFEDVIESGCSWNVDIIVNRKSRPLFNNICKKIQNIFLDTSLYCDKHYNKNFKLIYDSKYGLCLRMQEKNTDSIPASCFLLFSKDGNLYFSTEHLTSCNGTLRVSIQHLRDVENDYIFEQKRILRMNANLIFEVIEALSMVDVFIGFASLSEKFNYTRPVVLDKTDCVFELKNAKHPVLNSLLPNAVPNDSVLNEKKNTLIVTGVNMGGKSTYVKQNGLICIMAQVGCFVSAESATISVIDKIFARTGAMDVLYKGKSTFFMEMLDVREMLVFGTKYSLCLLDEVCIGTSYQEGLIILREIIKYLTLNVGCKVILSTHYHEMQELSDDMEAVSVFSFGYKIAEDASISFDFKLSNRKIGSSYPFYTIKLADFPEEMLQKIRSKLNDQQLI